MGVILMHTVSGCQFLALVSPGVCVNGLS
uniref:Uncharacterized protein n=1 Tax=Anguilla anguilla TaxID=7936 RepID=A0A0E9SNV2_ANGAN